jgi:ribosomal protein S18 acetylase RimI-like enzyme
MKPEFRPFEIGDTEAVVTLLREVLPDDQPHNEPAAVLALKMRTDNLSFVAIMEGTVCGFVMAGFDGHRGWLYQLAVDPNKRRSGVATGLVKYATSHLRKLGCEKLNLQVRDGNAAAESFYESLGFMKEPRTSMGKLLI